MRIFWLTQEAFTERLDRIENILGITEPTPAQQELDRILDEERE